MEQKNRVIAYIDGFNLYYGIKEYCHNPLSDPKPPLTWRRMLWLNLWEFADSFVKDWQKLEQVKYFTARISGDPAKEKRQSDFLEAIETLPNITVIYGQYKPNIVECPHCHRPFERDKEKMTDVNIAVSMLKDAGEERCDTALLISGDSDQSGAIQAVRSLGNRVVVAFPPCRFSESLKNAANHAFPIGIYRIAGHSLPPEITKPDGYVLRCPGKWWT